VRTTLQQREATEVRIRAAMDRLLGGNLPSGGKCDVKSLAAEAAITRSALYSTYVHPKNEFEDRASRLRQAGAQVDPRLAHIERLQTEGEQLKERLRRQGDQIAQLTSFRTTAISQLAAQQQEIEPLRRELSRHGNVVAFRKPTDHPPGQSGCCQDIL